MAGTESGPMAETRKTNLDKISRVLVMPSLEPSRQLDRIVSVERDIVLPVKLVLVPSLFFILFFSDWFLNTTPTRELIQSALRGYLIIYAGLILIGAKFLLQSRTTPLASLRRVVLGVATLDILLVACLTTISEGFASSIYWMFVVLVVRNALSMPAMGPQLILQLTTNLAFVLAGSLDVWVDLVDQSISEAARESAYERRPADALVRIALLGLTTMCCYALQALFERQRQGDTENREFSLRNEQVRTAGRLAAEIAHQIKNPLAIINNTAWSLQRSLRENANATQQLAIIREEVERSDRIITELMGYARLAEGKVEKLDVLEELDASIESVFPPGAGFESHLERHYEAHLPTLLMQRGHLREIFTNLLQNARDVVSDAGHIKLTVRQAPDDAIMVTIEDNGPGIPADKLEQVFEAYYTTRDKGTGLGLAIVRNNIELYGGSVRAESELGSGARFILRFPPRTVLP